MAREYAKTNLSIWQDDDWRAVPAPAQHLYQVLNTHPELSYCGVADWRPGRLVAFANGWTVDDIDLLADCLEARHFIVRDEVSEEVLVRSWIRFDGLIKQPRLSVSMANSFAAVSSNDIRGVIVHELNKLHDLEPGAAGWAKPQVSDLLGLRSIDPKSRATPKDPFGDGFGYGFAHTFRERLGETLPKVSVPVSVPPTTATATATLQQHHANQTQCASDDAPERFEEFWDTYDKKRDRKKVEAKYRTALKKPNVTPDRLIAAASSYIEFQRRIGKHPEFTKDPATWLNNESWANELADMQTRAQPGPSGDVFNEHMPHMEPTW